MTERPDGPGGAGDDPAREVWLRIRTLAGAQDVVAAEHAFLRSVGLTAGPVRVLRALLEGGPRPMRLLADRLGCDKSYVTGLVRPLVAAGLVTLGPDPRDGRVKLVTPTTNGLDVARRAQDLHETPPAVIQDLERSELLHLISALPLGD